MRHSTVFSSLIAAGLVVGLAACTPSGESTSSERHTADGSCAVAGAASDAVTIDGDYGQKPVYEFDGPLSPDTTERTIVSEGDGAEIDEGDIVDLNYSIINGATAEEIESTYDQGTSVQLRVDTLAPVLSGLSKTIACATEGSRIVGVIPPVDAFGEAGAPEFGLEASQSLVFIADIVRIAPEPLVRAEGEPQEAPADFPVVELAESGVPTITIPDAEPPAGYEEATLILGDGDVVPDGATVTVHYTGINWNTGEVFDSSWERGQPASFPTGGVIPGFRDALVGSTVGSQIVAIIPPELGYGPQGGTPDGSIGADDTIVFVVDILGFAG